MTDHDAVVLDLGQVVLRWDPFPAVAAGVGEAEARRFLAAFDFPAWNHAQDAGRSWADADVWLGEHHPEWRPHGRAYRAHFLRSLPGPVPGTSELVERLVAAGVPTHALTNWSAETFPLARERFPVLGRFGEIVVSGALGLAKPDPAVFAHTADVVGARPERIFFADDSAGHVAAARSAGWDAVVFTDAAALERDLIARGLLD